MSNTLIYSTDDEVMTEAEFSEWSNRFLSKKQLSVDIARVILNSK